MAASTSTKNLSGSPCGCGGSGSATNSPCACGGSCGGACSLCQNDGYSRPKFFAGQLLTEDDLQQLSDYVVAKNRLHARHLFGAGVVCGLDVTCYPCGGGNVTVNPGYALDCCGNDIVLVCPQELDINQMVRELQRKQHGGIDCGDPCAGTQPPPPSPAGPSVSTAGQPVGGAPTYQPPTEPPIPVSPYHKYCLYVNYCEQASDPVSPYATDDPCGSQTCETTRVREGFRFELRCPDPTAPVPPICDRYHKCLGDSKAIEKITHDKGFLQLRGREILAAYAAIQKSAIPSILNQETLRSDLATHLNALTDALGALKSEQPPSIKQTTVQGVVHATLDLGKDLAVLAMQRVQFQKDFWAKKPPGSSDRVSTSILDVQSALWQGSQDLAKPELQNVFDSELHRSYVDSLSRVTQSLLEQMNYKASGGTQSVDESTVASTPVQVQDEMVRLLAEHTVYGRQLNNAMVASVADLRNWLVYRLEQQTMKTRCGLLDSVNSAPVPTVVYDSAIPLANAYLAALASTVLSRSADELICACSCDALNPPCPTCDDPGVLLACITLEKCMVKDICNLDRQFVLSPVSIRYWFPEISRIARAIERGCCPDPCKEKAGYPTYGDRGANLPSFTTDPEAMYCALARRIVGAACPETEADRGLVANLAMNVFGMQAVGGTPMDLLGVPSKVARPAPATAGVVPETYSEIGLAGKLLTAQNDLSRLRADYAQLLQRVTRLEQRRAAKNPE
jgi:hypothetical protein